MPTEADERGMSAERGDTAPEGAPPALFAGRFELVAQLGGGHSGTVYRARDLMTGGHEVALKIMADLRLGSARARERFSAEAELLHELSHQGIVRIFGYGVSDDDIPYISMELLDGITLDSWAKAPAPSSAEKIGVLHQLAHALAFLHQHGLVHRDLKPSNILITTGGVVKVLDFGMATHAAEQCPTLGESTELAGTPGFMSPEQCIGEPATSRSDIFAFGVIAATLFGSAPFSASFSPERRRHELHAMQKAVRSSADIPLPLRLVIAQCLEHSSGERIPDGSALLVRMGQDRGRFHVARLMRSTRRIFRDVFAAAIVFGIIVGFVDSVRLSFISLMVTPLALIGINPMYLPLLLGLQESQVTIELIKAGDYEAVKGLLAANPKLQFDGSQIGPMVKAIEYDARELIPALAAHEPIALNDPHGRLYGVAFELKRWEMFPLLQRAGASAKGLDPQYVIHLSELCMTDEVRALLDAGFDLMQSVYLDEQWILPSVLLAHKSCPAVLDLLLARYPWQSWPTDNSGNTGLLYAISEGHSDLIGVMIAHGVDVEGTLPNQKGPMLVYAMNRKNGDEVFEHYFTLLSEADQKRLLEFDVLLQHAMCREHVRTTRTLVRHGAFTKNAEANLRTVACTREHRQSLGPRLATWLWGPDYLSDRSIREGNEASGAMLTAILEREQLTANLLEAVTTSALVCGCAPCVAALSQRLAAGIGGMVNESTLQMLAARTADPELILESWGDAAPR